MSLIIILQSNLLACRVCLATDVKLFDIRDKKTADAYSNLLGALATPITPFDGLPQHVCSSCGVLLLKFAEFRERAVKALMILNNAMLQQNVITTEYLRLIDRTLLNLSLPLKQTYIQKIEIGEHIENTVVIKQETIYNADEPHIEVKHETELTVDPLICNTDTGDILNNINITKEGNSELNISNKIHDNLGNEISNVNNSSEEKDKNIFSDLFSLIESDANEDESNSQKDRDNPTLITPKNRKRKKTRQENVAKALKMDSNITQSVEADDDFGNADIEFESDASSNCANDNSDSITADVIETLDINTEVANSNEGRDCYRDDIHMSDNDLHLDNKKNKNNNVITKKLPVKTRNRPDQIKNILKRINRCIDSNITESVEAADDFRDADIDIESDASSNSANDNSDSVTPDVFETLDINTEDANSNKDGDCHRDYIHMSDIDLDLDNKKNENTNVTAKKLPVKTRNRPDQIKNILKRINRCIETIKEIKIKQDNIKEKGEEQVRERERAGRKLSLEEIKRFENTYNVDIRILTKEEQMAEIEVRKNSDNYVNSRYKCELCYKGFTFAKTFNNHMAKHDPNRGNIECEVCHARFYARHRMRRHVYICHEMRITCRECLFLSRCYTNAKFHYMFHKGHKHQCEYCDKTFSKPSSHLSHVRLRHPAEMTSCEICGELFIGPKGVMCHMRKVHTELQNPAHKCASCKVQFHSSDALDKHADASNQGGGCDGKARACPECGENFVDKKHLEGHRQSAHLRERKCELCNRVFANETAYGIHHQRVHLHVRIKKEYCYRRQNYRKLIFDSSARFVCEICGITKQSDAALRYHQRVHTGERPYQCTLCPKRFAMAGGLKQHMLCHSDVRPYKCAQCPRSFRDQSTFNQHLKIHMRRHDDERPYKCTQCPLAFDYKTNFKRHLKVHTGEKPYTCDICGRSFSQSNSMKGHIKTVHMKIPAPPRRRRPRPRKVKRKPGEGGE